ncbi:membrane protein [Algoriphagus mannitolivorans]|uniref:membrane protein n=1 Tax=Algoriphagus mannitolivorans TaxID=226504 RepID=UPI000428AB28|nr:membrane protein [Algoriphagus mannitolivorans]
MNYFKALLIFLCCGMHSISLFSQQKVKFDSLYLAGVPVGQISNKDLDEISGLAFSRTHPNLIYVHTDSGGEPAVYLLDSLGQEIGKISLMGAANRDWEDIAVGPGPNGKSFVFVGEIGDNAGIHPEICIYRFPEPERVQKSSQIKPDILRLTFPGGARDAETLMVDPRTGDIYLVSKRDEKNTLYWVSGNAFAQGRAVLKELGKFEFTSAVAGDISADGSKILIKNYYGIYYWERGSGERLEEALRRTPKRLPYIPEPQGEAIGFNADGSAFFTLSEKRYNIVPTLYRFSKN